MQLIQTLLAGEKTIVELNRQQALEALEHALVLLAEHADGLPHNAVILHHLDGGAHHEDRQ